ncbi:MAG: hypothetical protein ABWY06_18175 [Pseudomonas sp.]|uniref:hypothetical protein n=1 Tax=Pseudomonas sp. TaxID=306 RepID=UPI00339996D1
MGKFAALLLLCAGLAGCTGGASLCQGLTPPAASGPTEQDNQRIETQSTGDPTTTGHQDQDC